MSTEKKNIRRPGEFVSTQEGGFYRIYDPERQILSDVPLSDFKHYEPVFQKMPKLTENSIKLHISEVPEIINKILSDTEKELRRTSRDTVFKSYKHDKDNASFVYVALGSNKELANPVILFSRRGNGSWKISKVLVFQDIKSVFDYEQVEEYQEASFTLDEVIRMISRFERERGIRYVCGPIRRPEPKPDLQQRRLMA